ncbi:3-hydroxyisobutyrate dehydrogenase [Pseudomonas sp. S 311-6]|jgi:3-hydroxyisobutyrate dehydrogenase|uniref:3-hydroxyisobutyrate dehydrogenase n=1 Tax=Kerstersia gyiorum TaxID=206506 RepID=UPI000FD91A85|nr:3-hydroxyisobutyrate dehydrogenase [Kerstersia gyiorum]AZV94087.1 3-hydroxyisobutyrate dehydrogenase [Bordetella sp. J329]MCO7637747.1 3-hydroxyisobutyrate dehydrogenase [Pseudomonas sp. S 311-6]MCH4271493.1 3-hydroxyisobutyrate dehydrogenase [Kerstersia gyiorum]MCI1229662.1 3-hydroxyisobutyrate dehydrogenase [Kerstersia gyiorum]MCR4158682.1 3-hydroxyisobutyrate dehydrogenase [Kerstersia gyiorum]
MRIAFIGLGNMGLPMAVNLLAAGHQVLGYDLAEAALEAFAAAGGQRAASARQALEGAQAVITMLPASRHVEALYLGDEGVLAAVPAGTLLVDCSTIAPAVARKVAAAAAKSGHFMLDAPVSGGTGGAKAGTLTFMVGGETATFERGRPLLEAMGKNIFHAGDCGSGQTVKVCNNMLLGILMAGTSEALRLGIANGMDPNVLSDVMLRSSGRNWTLEVYNPCPGVMAQAPASHGYADGFGVDLMLKDLGLAQESALATGTPTPLGALARNLYDLHSKAGHGRLDFSSIYNLLASQA